MFLKHSRWKQEKRAEEPLGKDCGAAVSMDPTAVRSVNTPPSAGLPIRLGNQSPKPVLAGPRPQGSPAATGGHLSMRCCCSKAAAVKAERTVVCWRLAALVNLIKAGVYGG